LLSGGPDATVPADDTMEKPPPGALGTG
jgi:hypothetical protein